MARKVTTTYSCDCCGKQLEYNNHYRRAYVKLYIEEWGGGSMGGDEDEFVYEAVDLCQECAHEIKYFLTQKMNLKRIRKRDSVFREFR